MENDVIYRYGGVYNKHCTCSQCLQGEVLAAMHDAPSSGHFAIHHTVHRISRKYLWPGVSNQVRSCANVCPVMYLRI